MRSATILLTAVLALAGTACKKKSGASEAIAKMNEFATKMCDCKTPECAKQVSDDMAKWGQSQNKGDKPGEVSPDDAKAMADATKKLSDCTQTAMAGGTGSGSAAGSGSAGSGSAMAGSGSDSGSGSSAMAGSGSGTGSGSGPGDEAPKLHMAGNCPSTVSGATTTAELKGKDVIVHVTSDDKAAIAAIQKRTEALLKEKADDTKPGEAHDQKGTHGGGSGICPVYYGEGGKATSKKEAKGVAITITPKEKPEALKATIDDRITKTTAWVKEHVKAGEKNQGGVGGAQGPEGANHSGKGDGKGKERKGGDGKGGGGGTGGGGGKGTGGGAGSGSGAK